MTRKQRLRRVAILCCHCLRNIAYYKAGWRNGSPIFIGNFWINTNGNFLEICILEWCKLFGDARGKHYWKKVITEKDNFLKGLLLELKIAKTELDSYATEMRTYRDKFVAHLDDENTAHIPKLDIAKKSASYLYDYLLANEDNDNYFPDATKKASTFYLRHLKEGKAVYKGN